MNDDYVKAFKRTIQPTLFQIAGRGKILVQPIVEDAYDFELVFRVSSEQAIAFRLEDFKGQTAYLKDAKRGAGKDNDGTIIDEAIFQIEVKRAKRLGKTHAHQQLDSGERWLRHILWLVVGNDELLKSQAEMPVYKLIIQMGKRSSLSRSHAYPVIESGDGYRIVVEKNAKRVDLTRTKSELIQRFPAQKFQV